MLFFSWYFDSNSLTSISADFVFVLESSCQYVELESERGVYLKLFSMCD